MEKRNNTWQVTVTGVCMKRRLNSLHLAAACWFNAAGVRRLLGLCGRHRRLWWVGWAMFAGARGAADKAACCHLPAVLHIGCWFSVPLAVRCVRVHCAIVHMFWKEQRATYRATTPFSCPTPPQTIRYHGGMFPVHLTKARQRPFIIPHVQPVDPCAWPHPINSEAYSTNHCLHTLRCVEAPGKFFVIFSPPSRHLLFPQLLHAKGMSSLPHEKACGVLQHLHAEEAKGHEKFGGQLNSAAAHSRARPHVQASM